jgi:hypothetical protein
VGLHALKPVRKAELGDMEALRCHLFTVEKFLADGEHEKTKSRM